MSDFKPRDLSEAFVAKFVREHKDGGARAEVNDTRVPGLALRVGKKGGVWRCSLKYVCDRRQAKRVWTLGRYPDVSLAKARKMAEAKRAERFEKGITAPVKGVTLQQAFDRWLAANTKVDPYAKPLRPRTVAWAKQLMSTPLAPWRDRPLAWFFDPANLAELSETIRTDRTPNVAAKSLELLKMVGNWNASIYAMREGLPAAMPNARKGKGSKPAPRETKFEPDEMPALYGAICRLDPVRRDAWLFALMTGQRASIVESLQWSDVNLAERTLTVAAEREGNKGAFTYTVALSAAVVNLLERRRDENEMMFGETAYVFPSNRPGRVHIDLRSEYSLPVPRRYTAQLAKAGAAWGGNACQVHAMRHTFTERALDDLGISEHDVRKLVGQKPVQGALASYVGADATSPRHREVVERISAHLLACMGLSPDHRFKAIDPEQRAA